MQSIKHQAVSATLQKLLILAIFAAGIGIRLYDLTDPPLDFHPARQIHSALMARGIYAKMGGAVPVEQQSQMIIMGITEGIIEPPINEYLVAYTYRLFNRDELWIARLYGIFFWTAGGIALLLLSRRLSGPIGSVAALTIYMLLPYGVYASRSFQPEPLMICLILLSLLAFEHWHRTPSWKITVFTGLLLGLAVLSKQIVLFYLGVVLLGYAAFQNGLFSSLRDRKFIAILILMVLPSVIYMVDGLFITGYLKNNTALRFFPEFYTQISFYLRWLRQIDQTVGIGLLVLSLTCLIFAKNQLVSLLSGGLVAGYVVSGFIFSYHISTHDYYHIVLIPAAALAIAPAFEKAYRWFSAKRNSAINYLLLLGLFVLWGGYQLFEVRSELNRENYRSAPEFWAGTTERLGGQNASVIGLLKDYGAGFNYWGLIYPAPWMKTGDVYIRSLGTDGFEQDFESQIEGKDYFVITDFEDLARQPELLSVLTSNYPLFDRGSDYLIFDLTKPGEPTLEPVFILP